MSKYKFQALKQKKSQKLNLDCQLFGNWFGLFFPPSVGFFVCFFVLFFFLLMLKCLISLTHPILDSDNHTSLECGSLTEQEKTVL